MSTTQLRVACGVDSISAGSEPDEREHFIPLRKAELIDRLCQQPGLTPTDATCGFRQLCQLLDATLHFEYHGQFRRPKTAYAPFDPDRDTQDLSPPSMAERTASWTICLSASLAAGAGQLSLGCRGPMLNGLAAVSNHGLSLEVDFNFFDRLEIYSRGEVTRHAAAPQLEATLSARRGRRYRSINGW